MLLPDRVVQALNLNLEAMEAQTQIQSRSTMDFTLEYGNTSLSLFEFWRWIEVLNFTFTYMQYLLWILGFN